MKLGQASLGISFHRHELRPKYFHFSQGYGPSYQAFMYAFTYLVLAYSKSCLQILVLLVSMRIPDMSWAELNLVLGPNMDLDNPVRVCRVKIQGSKFESTRYDVMGVSMIQEISETWDTILYKMGHMMWMSRFRQLYGPYLSYRFISGIMIGSFL